MEKEILATENRMEEEIIYSFRYKSVCFLLNFLSNCFLVLGIVTSGYFLLKFDFTLSIFPFITFLTPLLIGLTMYAILSGILIIIEKVE